MMRRTIGLVVLGACACACAGAGARARAGEDTYCPTITDEMTGAFLVHGARVFDGEKMVEPADVLVAGGEVIAVGAKICFRAKVGSVTMVDGAGATLKPLENGQIVAGAPAKMVLEGGGVREAEIVRRSRP